MSKGNAAMPAGPQAKITVETSCFDFVRQIFDEHGIDAIGRGLLTIPSDEDDEDWGVVIQYPSDVFASFRTFMLVAGGMMREAPDYTTIRVEIESKPHHLRTGCVADAARVTSYVSQHESGLAKDKMERVKQAAMLLNDVLR